MSDLVIRVESLSKRYRIGVREEAPRNLGQSVRGLVAAPFAYLRRMSRPPTEDETLWALRDVSFEVKQGEVLGIIGRNGAGKSTLLKILSRITEPTAGRAELHGRVGSLLEVGTGFHPELTGRENIYLSGAILGMRKAEIDRRFDEIVAFAEIEKFLDTPVKRYSSGMYVRLGFAVAAHLEPEILLVDEVLAVGDMAFQKKCLGKMGDIAQGGRTILFVSHDMQAVRQLCSRAILLDGGRVARMGSASDMVSDYFAGSAGAVTGIRLVGTAQDEPREGACLETVTFVGDDGRSHSQYLRTQRLRVLVRFHARRKLPAFNVAMALVHSNGVPVFSATFSDDRVITDIEPGHYEVEFVIDLSYLKTEAYYLTIYLISHGGALDHADGIPLPTVYDPQADALIEARRWGLVRIPVAWSAIREREDAC